MVPMASVKKNTLVLIFGRSQTKKYSLRLGGDAQRTRLVGLNDTECQKSVLREFTDDLIVVGDFRLEETRL
jgi:hypothetical protein